MSTSSSYARTLAKSRRYLLEALARRGFEVNQQEGFSVSAIHKMWQVGDLDMVLTNPTTGAKVAVRYHDTKALRANNITDYTDEYFNYGGELGKGDELIIVCKEPPNDSVKKAIQGAWMHWDVYISAIPLELLQFPLLDHCLVPKHVVLSETDAASIRERYNIANASQLPTISRFDPVALLIGLRPGKICEISRPSKTSVVSLFYRICSPY